MVCQDCGKKEGVPYEFDHFTVDTCMNLCGPCKCRWEHNGFKLRELDEDEKLVFRLMTR